MRTRFSQFDRITISGIQYKPVGEHTDGVQFARMDNTGAVERFTWEQIQDLKSARNWRFERDFYAVGPLDKDPQRSQFPLDDLPHEQRRKVFFDACVCEVIRELRGEGVLRLTDDSLAEHRALIEQMVYAREKTRNSVGQSPRGGKPFTMRHLPSARTIRKKFRLYSRTHRNAGVLRPRYAKNARKEFNHEASALLAECVEGYARAERPTKAIIAEETHLRFAEENKRRQADGRHPLPVPSRRTIERRIDRLDPFRVACFREGPDVARRKFSSYGNGLTSSAPMERIEIDEWKVDVISFFRQIGVLEALPNDVRARIPRGRRWICVAIDAATRCILGLVLAAEPSSQAAIKLLRMVVQDKTAIAREIGAESSWPQHGGLAVIATDAGSAFQSDAFQAAAQALHARLEYGPVRTPEMRGTVERFFGSLSGSLTPRLSGRTFSNVIAKADYASDARAVLDDGDLLRILLMWVVDVYHNTPHGGLDRQTPAARWRQLECERFVPEPPDRHTLRAATGIEVTRKISKLGVCFASNHYSSEALHAHFRTRKARDMVIRVDPDDLGEISVRIDGAWHAASCVEGGLDGVSLEAWKAACVKLRQSHRAEAALSADIRENALNTIKSIVDGRVASLLPNSLDPSAKKIDQLERTLFRGLTFAPPPDLNEMLGETTAFGTEIKPPQPEPEIKTKPRDLTSSRKSDQSPPPPPAQPSWRIEDE